MTLPLSRHWRSEISSRIAKKQGMKKRRECLSQLQEKHHLELTHCYVPEERNRDSRMTILMCDKGQTQNGTFLRVKSFTVTLTSFPRGGINKMSIQVCIFIIFTGTSEFLDLFLADRFGSNSRQGLNAWGNNGR